MATQELSLKSKTTIANPQGCAGLSPHLYLQKGHPECRWEDVTLCCPIRGAGCRRLNRCLALKSAKPNALSALPWQFHRNKGAVSKVLALPCQHSQTSEPWSSRFLTVMPSVRSFTCGRPSPPTAQSNNCGQGHAY